jgi:hypothetical protein
MMLKAATRIIIDRMTNITIRSTCGPRTGLARCCQSVRRFRHGDDASGLSMNIRGGASARSAASIAAVAMTPGIDLASAGLVHLEIGLAASGM